MRRNRHNIQIYSIHCTNLLQNTCSDSQRDAFTGAGIIKSALANLLCKFNITVKAF
jgi:hypothetical protein